MRVPWTTTRSKQSILKEINHEYSLEGLMLKLQYFGHLMKRSDSLEKGGNGSSEGLNNLAKTAETVKGRAGFSF